MKKIKIEAPEGYEIDKEKSTFEQIVFKKKDDWPESWVERWEDLGRVDGCYIGSSSRINEFSYGFHANHSNRNVYPTKELAEAALAQAQLLQLRDRVNVDWVPDWDDDDKKKYIIRALFGEIVSDYTLCCFHWLHLKDEQTSERFLKTHRDLIEVAAPLL